MKVIAVLMLIIGVGAQARAGELNLATLTCGKYENEVLPAAADDPTMDSINTVMWLFGYSVAKSGAHVMYPDALSPFGFALDGECKSNPAESMLDALVSVKIEAKNPMDLATVECAAFASHHAEFARSDVESATTIMMWLHGFAVGKSGSHLFQGDLVPPFQTALLAACAKLPHQSLLDALKTLKLPQPASAPR